MFIWNCSIQPFFRIGWVSKLLPLYSMYIHGNVLKLKNARGPFGSNTSKDKLFFPSLVNIAIFLLEEFPKLKIFHFILQHRIQLQLILERFSLFTFKTELAMSIRSLMTSRHSWSDKIWKLVWRGIVFWHTFVFTRYFTIEWILKKHLVKPRLLGNY
jgi:hypothetical protein